MAFKRSAGTTVRRWKEAIDCGLVQGGHVGLWDDGVAVHARCHGEGEGTAGDEEVNIQVGYDLLEKLVRDGEDRHD